MVDETENFFGEHGRDKQPSKMRAILIVILSNLDKLYSDSLDESCTVQVFVINNVLHSFIFSL